VKILAIQALRGPNFWSNDVPKLIQSRLDLSEQNKLKEQVWENFLVQNSLLVDWIFQLRTQSDNTLSKLAFLALALQKRVGAEVDYFDYKATKFDHCFNLVFEYETEMTGKQAVKSAVAIINQLAKKQDVDFSEQLDLLSQIFQSERPGPQLQQLISKAQELNIPYLQGDSDNKFQFGYGKNSVLVSQDSLPVSLDTIFPQGQNGRIPIIAITGSNGKTTTTRLIAHILKVNGYKVGFTTSDGIYIDGEMIDKGDTTGPMSAEIVLRNKEVEVAVLETARGGIVRAGLGFDSCDISVVTNVQEDHLGISDIETMEDLTQVKGVIVKATKPLGLTILNADNNYAASLAKQAPCRVSWFGLNLNNPILADAMRGGANAAYIQEDKLVIKVNNQTNTVIPVSEIPITFGGKVGFMVQNALAATLATALFGISPMNIAKGLKTFMPSAEQTPGRMNIFELSKCKVLVDFAHNPDGFGGIRDFLSGIESPNKIGIIVATGDRKEEDIIELGRLSAEMFDHILIHQVKFLRGKTAEELVASLVKGIELHKPSVTWQRVPDNVEPLAFAYKLATPGSFITALSDVLNDPFELIKTLE
jgi:UDP-N-acetylmuramyl tripeptide synthase